MAEQTENVYQFAPLSGYSLKQRIMIRLADWIFYGLIRIICGTIRFQTEGAEHLETIAKEGRTPVYAVWHDRIFVGTYSLRNRGIVFLTSQSFDGEYIARFLQRLGFGTIRGSSTRGGSRALAEMIRLQKRSLPMGFTVDGPKGPRHEAKPGPIMVAKKTGDPILPFSVTPKHYFSIGSWDKLMIPLPFTKALTIYSEPIFVAADSDNIKTAEKLADLQNSLDDLQKRGELWRSGS